MLYINCFPFELNQRFAAFDNGLPHACVQINYIHPEKAKNVKIKKSYDETFLLFDNSVYSEILDYLLALCLLQNLPFNI